MLYSQALRTAGQQEQADWSVALDAYNKALARGRRAQLAAHLTRRSRSLRELSAELRGHPHTQYYAGRKSVPVAQVRGTEGRSKDFDVDFNPLRETTRDRWVSVYRALEQGAALPAVDLLQVGEVYYVRDGHHRISAARALGQDYVDATVTVLNR